MQLKSSAPRPSSSLPHAVLAASRRRAPQRQIAALLLPSLLALLAAAALASCSGDSSPPGAGGGKGGPGLDGGERDTGPGDRDGSLAPDAGDQGFLPFDAADADQLAGYREPCEQNADCQSGWCVAYGGGHVCTRPCSDECDGGWLCRVVRNQGSDVTSICMPPDDRLCAPCTDSRDCDNGACVALDPRDQRSYCIQPCFDGECREGFACADYTLGDTVLEDFCVPVSGTCTCNDANDGLDRLCIQENEHGTCLGREVCRAAEGWVDCDAAAPAAEICNGLDDDCNGFGDDVAGLGAACVQEAVLPDGPHFCVGVLVCTPDHPAPLCTAAPPTSETCNHKDDDCDGEVDEDYPLLGQTCQVGQGSCLRLGAYACDELTGDVRCLAEPGEPAAEACNHLDDDCDGQTDEDFREPGGQRYVSLEHCGACGQSCVGLLPHATARCDGGGGQALPTCVVDTCEPGYYQAGPTLCLEFEDPGCAPCASDINCLMPGNLCLELDGARFCGRDCAAGNLYGTEPGWCPDGFVCTPLPELGEEVAQCLPVTGSCTCFAPEHGGAARSCLGTNELGACAGLQLCDPQAGWSECSAGPPTEEVCNGRDDDCDGRVDEDVAEPLEPCVQQSEAGTCSGPWRCAGPDGWLCQAALPAAEQCNYQDDDCDGQTDEDFRDPESGAYVGPDDCGLCGLSCAGTIPYAVETGCALTPEGGAACIAVECQPDFFVPPDSPRICLPRAGGFDCSPCLQDEHCTNVPGGRCTDLGDGERLFCLRGCAAPEECADGYDCVDGLCRPWSGSCTCLPDDAGASRLCVAAGEAGSCIGTEVCDPEAGWSPCSARIPQAEACNGLDDDCDMLIDEGVQHPEGPGCSLANEHGTCPGLWSCAGEAGWECHGTTPAAETCNGVDDDCDGLTDEGFRDPDSGLYTTLAHCGQCNFSCAGRVLHATEVVCDAASGTPTCAAQSCEAGYYRAEGGACVPVTANRCAPCVGDQNCPVAGDRCLELDGSRVCGQDCAAGNLHGTPEGVCPAGFTCRELGEGVRQCVPLSGSCSCLPEHGGNTRWCSRGNELGRCTGFETCDPLAGWLGCTAGLPEPERCDGQDNDCNGIIDEGFAELNQPCTAGEGACARAGVVRCSPDGSGTACSAQPGEAQPESCNYQDDDCDGETDEDFRDPATGLYADFQHCGVCNNSCEGAILFATETACSLIGASAVCIATACEPGWRLSANGRVCLPPSGATDCSPCQVDEHCASLPGGRCEQFAEGQACTRACDDGEGGGCEEGYDCVAGRCWPISRSCTCLAGNAGEMRICTRSNAEGTCMGTQTCDPASTPGWQPCTAAVPAAESCDGLDNNCNDLVDEGVAHPAGPRCEVSNEWGTCSGIWLCQGLGGWGCSAAAPAQEACNSRDDDCDGLIDEDFPELLIPCSAGTGDCRVVGVARCTDDGAGTFCTAQAGEPGLEICDGQDNDCDGTIDNGFPDLFQPCLAGDGACQRAGVIVCAADGMGTRCDAVPGQPSAEVCDSVDNDCNGLIDEGFAELGTPCIVGVGACQRVGITRCSADGLGTACSVEPGAEGAEICNGIDDDCDGVVDDGPSWVNKGQPCTLGVGACARPGSFVCNPADPAGPTVCNAVSAAPQAEACDGLDNDCNGTVDDLPLDDRPLCAEQRGVCSGSRRTCGGAAGWFACNSSNYPATYESTETRCDGLDNDCDGQTDEGLVGDFCPLQQGVCAGARQVCSGGAWDPCSAASYGPEYEPVEASCDLLDNDCDGQTDEDWLHDGKYDGDTACGNCFTDCTIIYAKPHAYGVCDAAAAAPRCEMRCDPGYFDLNRIPDDGCELGLDPLAIYVSINDPQADDLDGCGRGPVGTGGGHRPCRTIAAGLAEASLAGRSKVLVADGLYEETVTLVNGVSLLGGYRADTWERHIASSLTVLRGAAAPGTSRTVVARGIGLATVLEGFVIYGPSNFTAAGNSYALHIVDSGPGLVVRDNVIYGGFAGAGANGVDGAEGTAGRDGQPGENAILTNVRSLADCQALAAVPGNQGLFGDGGVLSCAGVAVNGGAGAGARCPSGNNAQPNGNAGLPAAGGGAGGTGGNDRTSSDCNNFGTGGFSATGLNGANGAAGSNGGGGVGCPPANDRGSVHVHEWLGTGGNNGGNGTAGAGGGGGGAGGGADVTVNCSGEDDCLGGSGGGGGSGACGGGGAAGGQAGGGAFAVFISFTNPTAPASMPVLEGNRITRGQGGDGGNGGVGGAGGLGGDGANGGAVGGQFAFAMGQGGRGGQGGDGGAGGGGGGGCGGVSFGIWVANASAAPSYDARNTFLAGGAGGIGGVGGPSLGNSGSAGANGASADVNW